MLHNSVFIADATTRSFIKSEVSISEVYGNALSRFLLHASVVLENAVCDYFILPSLVRDMNLWKAPPHLSHFCVPSYQSDKNATTESFTRSRCGTSSCNQFAAPLTTFGYLDSEEQITTVLKNNDRKRDKSALKGIQTEILKVKRFY
ncbi:unnamed protein product [Allacma fusca]|uniref:Uncharacterized protein n=1 Tax=Allacma fusca TaxID=39272 RepID=A0A8J2PM16_9HEXA|nr:unnamed protein product [Allacma fusca]